MSQEHDHQADATTSFSTLQLWAIPLGPIAAITGYWAFSYFARLDAPSCGAAAIAILMGVWWMTEALPLGATALLPLVLLPLLGVYGNDSKLAMKTAAAPYADSSIFLYLGGFFLASAVEKWGLHRRLAYGVLMSIGTKPSAILAGVLGITAFLSMWVSNTATTVMMLPIAMSIVALADRHSDDQAEIDRFSTSLLLGTAYAAGIGGCATLIGTPTNAVFAGFLKDHDIPLNFYAWMKFAIPVAIVYLIVLWCLFTFLLFPIRARSIGGGEEYLREQMRKLGPMSKPEIAVAFVFGCAIFLWVGRDSLVRTLPEAFAVPLKRCEDSTIAIAAALVLFAIPVDLKKGTFLLDWHTAVKAPWDALLIFGGGLSLAEAIGKTQLSTYLGEQLKFLQVLPMPILISCLCLSIIFFSEFTSNLATIATLMPFVWSLAEHLGCDPLLLLVPAALAASYAFMMPAGTPPNAIVFGTGRVPLRSMMRAGLALNLFGGLAIPLAVYWLGGAILGIKF